MDAIRKTAASSEAALPAQAQTGSALTRRYSTTFQVLLVVWLVLAGFVGYLVAGLSAARRSAELRVHEQAASYARLVEHHAAAAFARADIALLGIMDHLLPGDLADARSLDGGRRKALESLLLQHQGRTPGVIGTFLVDARGEMVAHSRGTPLADVSDRDYFRSLRQQSPGTVLVSQAVRGRVTGRWGLQVVRRVDLPDGRFGGLVGATLGITENFTDFYATLTLGRNSTVSLRDARSRLLVRFPVLESRLGTEVGVGGLKEHLVAGEGAGAIVATSDMDRAVRIFGFRKLSGFPIYAVVGLSIDDALSAWRLERDTALAGTLLFVLAGAFITTVLLQKRQAESLRRQAELELSRLNELHEEQAIRDPLTGLFNRRYLEEALDRELAEAARGNFPVSFVMMDIDHFKAFNDRFGHQAGDLVLRAVGGELRGTTRGGDIACRYGGEEFLLVLPRTPLETAVERAEQWRLSVEALAVPYGSSLLNVTISAGVAAYPADAGNADTVISAADRALYAAKGAGRNRVSRL